MLAIYGLMFTSILVVFAGGRSGVKAADAHANEAANKPGLPAVAVVGSTTTSTPPPSKRTKPTRAPPKTKRPKYSITTTAGTPQPPVRNLALGRPNPAPAPSGPTTPSPKPGKVNCGACQAVGEDCTPTYYDKDVDYCCKVTGTIDDPKKLNPIILYLLQAGGGGNIQAQMSKNKGKRATVRKGVAQAALGIVGMKGDPGPGCTNYAELGGMKDVVACLCYDDCP